MKKLVKGIAFVGAATTAGGSPPLGIAPKKFEVMKSNTAISTTYTSIIKYS